MRAIIDLFTLLAIGFALALIGVDQAFAADLDFVSEFAALTDNLGFDMGGYDFCYEIGFTQGLTIEIHEDEGSYAFSWPNEPYCAESFGQ